MTIVKYHENNKDFDYLINNINWDLRESFRRALTTSNPEGFYEAIKNSYALLVPHEDKLKIYLHEYFLKDGYPELLDLRSLPESGEKLRTYLNLTLYKDIVRIFDVRDPRALEELAVLLADASSQRINYDDLSKTLSIKRDTLIKYLHYLESIFIISRAEFYAQSRASRLRKQKNCT